MLRSALPALLGAGLVLASLPAPAQTSLPRPVRKAVRQAKPAPASPSFSGNINAPSTDFSKVERAGEDDPRDGGGRLRPVMGSGGMGLGGAF